MENKRSLIIVVVFAFILTTVFIVGSTMPVAAGESCNIVTIHGRSGINPKTITVSKGSCVIWMNWTRNEDVALSFKEGSKCIGATKAPMGFKADQATGCFIAERLSYGNTVSLVFSKPGTYDYDLVFSVAGNTKGTVIVEE